MYSFSYLEPVCCSMSGSNCCFLTRIQISQEAGQMVWCSHLFQNFPQFVVIHTVKGFGLVNKAELDVFSWNCLAFLMILWMLAIWSLVPLPFLKPAWKIKTWMRYHYTPVRMAAIQKSTRNKCWIGCGEKGTLLLFRWSSRCWQFDILFFCPF